MKGLLPLFFFFVCISDVLQAQTGQIDINKVGLMHNMPSPYGMRNWKKVTLQYDSFVYNLNATGQYLPLMHLRASGVNYPSLKPILFDSYVGSASSGSQAEAINIIPSLVGASLVGVDKSNQFGNNWVLKAKDFFNQANAQNIYLNGYAATSGGDWWYDVMPNIFFYQLYSLYPATQDFQSQFSIVADRWLSAVNTMGGSTTPWRLPNMNYRAFNFSTMTPVSGSWSEPEAAGAIGWILYQAYQQTGKKKYLEGAEMAIGYLASLNSNPAYEIQLPYGIYTAARMNAELGTNYNITKMINWSFDQSSVRNWGTIVGTWGNTVTGMNDVSGLIGEVDNPSTGYAFAMNGFQHAAALVPMVKYDKRFARTIAKWVLNLANASRLFYRSYLPASHQDSYLWSSGNDPKAVLGYEALKQKGLNDSLLFATGDAKRSGWAQTNLGLYGSSHVGYMASLIDTTEVQGILLLNLNKTDFFASNSYPTYLVYNPLSTSQAITLQLGTNNYDIYDALSQQVIKTSATSSSLITIPSDQAMMLVYVPAGSSLTNLSGKLYANQKIIDYHYGYNFNGKLIIQSLAAADTVVQYNKQITIYSSVRNKKAPVTFNWYVNGDLSATTTDSSFVWTAPSLAGSYRVRLNISDGVSLAMDSIQFNVVPRVPALPTILSVSSDSIWCYTDSAISITCRARANAPGKLKYSWRVANGSISHQSDSVITWRAPSAEGLYSISVTVKNSDSLLVNSILYFLIKSKTNQIGQAVAYYPFDGNVKDYSGNNHHGTLSGVQPTSDARGLPDRAYRFSSNTDIIDVPNASSLNFQNRITLSCWVKLDMIPAESYVLSHGSYQQRWKISILSNSKVRWTINTTNGITDLDSSFPLQLNTFYHITVVYTGYSTELYINGWLNAYASCSGLLNTSNVDITFGKMLPSVTNYGFYGTLDEVRIYDQSLGPNEIILLKGIWNTTTNVIPADHFMPIVYPNPTSTGVFFVSCGNNNAIDFTFTDILGRTIKAKSIENYSEGVFIISFDKTDSGLILMKMSSGKDIFIKKVLIQ
ncbi:MAG: T9SS type A sorting domain-containing protein [Bacteroidetes bacterium]|nr:T9SS type A sorting domain-containing protein [Bacteroidota bacterium]